MNKCKNCEYFVSTNNEKGTCFILESNEDLECCISDKNNYCKMYPLKIDLKLKSKFMNFLEFLKAFKDFKIEIQYYWDVTEEVNRLKDEGYTEDQIQIEYDYYDNKDYDAEYSFIGSYEELLKHNENYGCYDYKIINDIDSFTIIISETFKMICIKLLVL